MRSAENPEHSLTTHAVLRGGVFTRGEALSAGLTTKQVRHRVESGRWVTLRRGAYTDRATWDQTAESPAHRHRLAAAAAVTTLTGRLAVSHESAAVIHGLPLLRNTWDEVTVTGHAGARVTPAQLRGVRLHVAALPRAHLCRAHGLPTTTPVRTVVDLARRLPFREAVVVADAALRQGRATPDDLGGILLDCWNWPGIRRATRALAAASPLSESALETLARVAFIDLGLPRPVQQSWVGAYRVDFLWPELRTICEVDGLSKYTKPDVLVAEKRRQEHLAEMGFEVVRATWADVTRDPQSLGMRIRRAFARAERAAG